MGVKGGCSPQNKFTRHSADAASANDADSNARIASARGNQYFTRRILPLLRYTVQ